MRVLNKFIKLFASVVCMLLVLEANAKTQPDHPTIQIKTITSGIYVLDHGRALRTGLSLANPGFEWEEGRGGSHLYSDTLQGFGIRPDQVESHRLDSRDLLVISSKPIFGEKTLYKVLRIIHLSDEDVKKAAEGQVLVIERDTQHWE